MTDSTSPRGRRLGRLTVVAAAILSLAACGGGGEPENGKAGTSETPSGSSARPKAAKKPATPKEVFDTYKLIHKLGTTPQCSQVDWDDASCGGDLTAAGKTARAVSEHIDEDFPGRYPEEKEAADDMVKMVNTIKKLGCFKMGDTPPGGGQERTKSLCTTLGTTASLSWLNLASTLD